ncbi:unnamed protein product [Effrenium voratum]|nr:unnamed protein product [Effrenium voratum]
MRVIPLLCFLIVKCQTSEHLVLWQDGEERYQALVAVIGHQGSCQPECIETRTVVVPPNVFYKVRVEVAQVDMHSEDEQVSVKVGGQQVTCSPKVASDYNCSLVENVPTSTSAGWCNRSCGSRWKPAGPVTRASAASVTTGKLTATVSCSPVSIQSMARSYD